VQTVGRPIHRSQPRPRTSWLQGCFLMEGWTAGLGGARLSAGSKANHQPKLNATSSPDLDNSPGLALRGAVLLASSRCLPKRWLVSSDLGGRRRRRMTVRSTPRERAKQAKAAKPAQICLRTWRPTKARREKHSGRWINSTTVGVHEHDGCA